MELVTPDEYRQHEKDIEEAPDFIGEFDKALDKAIWQGDFERSGGIERLKAFLQKEVPEIQAFNTPNIAGDPMEQIYKDGEVEVWHCKQWGYIEIFGLSQSQFNGLVRAGHLRKFRIKSEGGE